MDMGNALGQPCAPLPLSTSMTPSIRLHRTSRRAGILRAMPRVPDADRPRGDSPPISQTKHSISTSPLRKPHLSSLAALRQRLLSALIKPFSRMRAGRSSCATMRRARARGAAIFETFPALKRASTVTKVILGTHRRRRISLLNCNNFCIKMAARMATRRGVPPLATPIFQVIMQSKLRVVISTRRPCMGGCCRSNIGLLDPI